MEFQLSYFKPWKMVLKDESALLNMLANLEYSAVATGLEKVSFHFNPQERQCQRMLKLLHNCTHLTFWQSKAQNSPRHASFNSMWAINFQIFQLVLEKSEEPEIKLPTSADHQKNKRVPEKHLFLLYWLCQSLWLCGSQYTVENSSRDGNTRPPYLPPEKSVCRSRSNS